MQFDDDDDEHVPANLIHHYLLAICTRPGIGICFKDKGWYPRGTDPDCVGPREDEDSKMRTGKIHNKILANVLKSLKVNEDSRQQELAIKILSACPELVAGCDFILLSGVNNIILTRKLIQLLVCGRTHPRTTAFLEMDR